MTKTMVSSFRELIDETELAYADDPEETFISSGVSREFYEALLAKLEDNSRKLSQALRTTSWGHCRDERLVRSKENIDLATDPPSDLVLEVEYSRSAIDKLLLQGAELKRLVREYPVNAWLVAVYVFFAVN